MVNPQYTTMLLPKKLLKDKRLLLNPLEMLDKIVRSKPEIRSKIFC